MSYWEEQAASSRARRDGWRRQAESNRATRIESRMADLEAENERLREAIRILQENWPKTIPAPMDTPHPEEASRG